MYFQNPHACVHVHLYRLYMVTCGSRLSSQTRRAWPFHLVASDSHAVTEDLKAYAYGFAGAIETSKV